MSTAADLRAFAIAQVGKPYLLGADGPTKWDCSGLCLGVLNHVGAGLADMTAAGLWNITTATSSPRVGDMVFLANHTGRPAPAGYRYGIGHVAIITAKLSSGDWEIVEAKSTAAGVVRTSLSAWTKRAHYAGIRRYPKLQLASAPTAATTTPARLDLDGDIGPKSVDALQWSLGITRTRVMDQATRAAVCAWLGVSGHTLTTTAVKALQRWLDVTADGALGPVTAVRWQQWLNAQVAAASAQQGGADFRLGFANLQGYDSKIAPATIAASVKAKLGASALLLCETKRTYRRAIEAAHGPTFWVIAHPGGTVAIGIDLARFAPGKPSTAAQVGFGTAFGHGALRLPVTRRATGRQLDLISVHIRPKAVASTANKHADVAKTRALKQPGRPALCGGDFALNDPPMPDWTRLSPRKDSMDAPGTQTVDATYRANTDAAGLDLIGAELIDPGPISDHKWGLVKLTAK